MHFVRALEHPRWEDFSYEPLEKMDRNRFYWLGNGATRADMDPAGNKAFYLDNIDVPPGKKPFSSEQMCSTHDLG